MGAADLQKIRRFPGWRNTLRCRSKASWFAQTRRTQAREGTSGGESLCDRSGMTCSEGGSEALEPRPWNQNGRAQVPWSPRSFRPRIPQSSRLWSIADKRVQRTRQRVPAYLPERACRAGTPGAAADLACPRGWRESKPSRWRETARTDGAGPWSARVIRISPPTSLEGREPQEGRSSPAGLVRALWPVP